MPRKPTLSNQEVKDRKAQNILGKPWYYNYFDEEIKSLFDIEHSNKKYKKRGNNYGIKEYNNRYKSKRKGKGGS